MRSATVRRRGRRCCCPLEVAERIIQLRQLGLSYESIAATLNTEGIPTPLGRPRWAKSHVDRLLHTQWMRDIMTELQGASVTVGIEDR